jgi:hypothetical protein
MAPISRCFIISRGQLLCPALYQGTTLGALSHAKQYSEAISAPATAPNVEVSGGVEPWLSGFRLYAFAFEIRRSVKRIFVVLMKIFRYKGILLIDISTEFSAEIPFVARCVVEVAEGWRGRRRRRALPGR